MANRQRTRPQQLTSMIHTEVAVQAPIVPQRQEAVETARQRSLEPVRGRVGRKEQRELYQACFPVE